MSRAVFLDRDGVINATLWNSTEEKWDSPYTLEDFQLLPGTAQAIRSMNELGYLTVVISNQPGVAKGKCSPQFLDALDRKMLLDLAREDARLDAIYYCLHHPDAQVESLRVACGCRKPKPDLLLRAACLLRAASSVLHVACVEPGPALDQVRLVDLERP